MAASSLIRLWLSKGSLWQPGLEGGEVLMCVACVTWSTTTTAPLQRC